MKTGKLKIFFGYADGSGKTYTMLQAALRQKALGFEVVIASLSPQTRQETYMLAQDLEIISFDQDSTLVERVIKRNPQVVLIDDLGNRQSSVEALLSRGFDIYTTLNVFDIKRIRDELSLSKELFANPGCFSIPTSWNSLILSRKSCLNALCQKASTWMNSSIKVDLPFLKKKPFNNFDRQPSISAPGLAI